MNPGKVDELDQYDLLGAGADDASPSTVPETNLSSTTQAFNARIQRKKREQEKVLGEAERLAKQRHLLVLHALMNIRKSLRDVTRIDLGDRFHFSLHADDWQGWPRLSVKLTDSLIADADHPIFRVTAHDRQARGAIEIEYDPSQSAESISLLSEADIKRLPNLLKKCVRAFLDLTGDIVLEAERRTEEVIAEKPIVSRSLESFDVVKKHEDHPALSGDVFQDDSQHHDNFLETLPSIDEVQALPDAAASGTRKVSR